ncbi:tetratricopeptide repeat protein [Polynucleobacter paneuropaeus]|nr:tetratricopeptide repeat protein [Polynucleobacter paneuropaeus]
MSDIDTPIDTAKVENITKVEPVRAPENRALVIEPNEEQMLKHAVELHRKGSLDEADLIYQKILHRNPEHFDAIQLMGTVAVQKNLNEKAIYLFNKAILIKDTVAAVYNNLGNAYKNLGEIYSAILCFRKAITLDPKYNVPIFTLATIYKERVNEKIQYKDLAIQCYLKHFENDPKSYGALVNLGAICGGDKQFDRALDFYQKAITLEPNAHIAYFNRALLFKDMGKPNESIKDLGEVIRLKPDFAGAHKTRANIFKEGKRYQLAVNDYAKTLEIDPNILYGLGDLVHAKMHLYDWKNISEEIKQVEERLIAKKLVVLPLPLSTFSDSPALQRTCAELFVSERFPEKFVLPHFPPPTRKPKIKVGYFSQDFRDHAVSFLMAEIFELHNRDLFEVHAFSIGFQSNGPMRERLIKGVDFFHDVVNTSDIAIAELARKIGIDIAFDLAGFTGGSRTNIFAFRIAPLQVAYIGYLGTIGAPYIDYLIADHVLVPDEAREYYAEKIIYLPHYQANDSKRPIPVNKFDKKHFGIPDGAFTFACLNTEFKITPEMFSSWMRVLGAVKNSVLMLLSSEEITMTNLKNHAIERGIDPSRLIFTGRIPREDYLARFRCVDLFLDTNPYNAGTTASDALWVGLPVLTLMGKSFPARICASILTAMDLPELITTDAAQYEATAIKLATNPELLTTIRKKIEKNRTEAQLFNPRFFTEHLEYALQKICERYWTGLPPADVDCSAVKL